METIEVASRSFVIKWVTAPEGSAITFKVHPLKKSINVGIFEKERSNNLQVEIEAEGHNAGRRASISAPHSGTIEKRLESSGLSPVLPLKKCNANEQSEGVYKVPKGKGGIYALVFDNTFSKTTPKTVHFTVQAMEEGHAANNAPHTLVSETAVSGILLKKRRKKLQGYTRRYFVLDLKLAILNYYTDPKSNSLRGSLPLTLCAISASKAQRLIFVDSGMEVWNLKALNDADWQIWVDTFERIRKGKSGGAADEPVPAVAAVTAPDQEKFAQLVAKLRETKDISDVAAQEPGASNVTKDLNARLAALYLEFTDVVSHVAHESAMYSQPMAKRASFNGSIMSEHDTFYDAEENPDKDGVVFLDDDAVDDDDDGAEHDSTDEEDEGHHVAPVVHDADDADDLYPLHEVQPVKHRVTLPDAASTPPSMLGILKKSVGKDMGSMAVPITTNEPISALQRFAEMFEYPQLLDEAENVPANDGERIIYVATWAVSYLASMRAKERALRKPFNPLLGETYELVRPDLGYRLISEKVCHHPPVMALHVDSEHGWSVAHSSEPVQKFWGKSMEINYLGPIVVKFRQSGEVFHWSNPTTYLRNIMAGEKYTEPVGDFTIFSSTGEKAIVEFKAGGMFSGRSEELNIKAVSANGSNLPCFASGKWTEQITLNNAKGQKKTIWKVGNLVNNHTKKWGFTEFTAGLNEVTPIEKGHASPYDSRFRPDQKEYEAGQTDKAEAGKQELEEKQRERRKVLQDSGKTYKPTFFEKSSGLDGVNEQGDLYLLTKGPNNYWNRRKQGNWEGLTPLW
ncbi:Oxysterol-binding protein-domain-containing protein [Yarrowia lipolytica]|jgi:hypothetical protein|uniref:YALI0E22781p n=2 Tax=Yarrowia lipolytica TaxID=4952 RepID=Q6C4Y2_YARLI|nr:YALI0E22781p [Yarrowia lipolytica CLIB122]AOW05809.1 hypothetical protein YALI1_E26930g [Yarrowia lipolytica]KAB8285973.1 Oxysterol-binding protein-domain-containing protein [Yarrowia lipolytica]KAE8172476.1 Oxysterol-binding protein-domain-containing protein [Yarrowia lipolytica]KAJ8057256.1 Oxysterol-binding protein-domain-containing protein [Yarrowia lipolytica]QNP99144.1 Oxysterol-binding protein 3 [Yarrowia lipolytica]|eukprot:XP_504280.1 YALI0E22781p [Yarrowia lipolytica CLIB122]